MSHSTDLSRLFDQLESLSIGFGPVFRDFQRQTNSYPPHNILVVSDTEFNLEVALAGFKKDDISIEMHQGLLTVKGDKKTNNNSNSDQREYQHRGIATRSFSKSFRIAEYFEVESAAMEDGILTVHFVKNVPEEAKPKLITIG